MRKLRSFVVLLLFSMPVQLLAADGHGLKAEYFDGTNLNNLVTTREEPSINFFWDHAAPLEGVPRDRFSLRLTGWLKVPRAARYKFILNGNDGVRFWLDDSKVIDHWKGGDVNEEISIELDTEPHPIRLEYFEGGGPGWLTLFWTYPGAKTFMPVPAEVFFLDERSAKTKSSTKKISDDNGLNMEFFSDINLKRMVGSGGFPKLESVWGNGAPATEMNADHFSVRLTGYLQPPKTGRYKLAYLADNGIRLSIDNKVIFNSWKDAIQREEAFVDLEADKLYPIRLEYMETIGWSCVFVHWTLPESDTEISIAPEYLFRTKNAVKKKTK